MNVNNITTQNSGEIAWNKVFIEIFDCLPNTYHIFLDKSQRIDIFDVNNNIETFFPSAKYYTKMMYDHNKTSSQNDEDQCLNVQSSSNIRIIDETNKEIWIIYDSEVVIYCVTLDQVKFNRIITSFKQQTPESNTNKVQLVALDNGYYYTIKSDIAKTNIDLNENYNDDFLKVHENVLKFLDSKETGVMLIHGEKGTGKTHWLRHIISNTDKDYLVVTNSVAAHIAEPEFISFLLSKKNSVFILEDCEQIIMERENNLFGGAIANILNMSDGLLSDIFNIKFICTFNTNIDKIDKALLRKGRCKINYEFKKLKADKVAKLNEKYNLGIKTIQDMTLADIYNYSEEVEEKKTRKIGF